MRLNEARNLVADKTRLGVPGTIGLNHIGKMRA